MGDRHDVLDLIVLKNTGLAMPVLLFRYYNANLCLVQTDISVSG